MPDDHDELSLRRESQAGHQDLDARLRGEILEGQREPSFAALQRRVEAASRERTSARSVLAELQRRARRGDAVAAGRLPAASDRAAAAGDRLVAALDRRSAAEVLLRSSRDELSGALQRATGMRQLEQELLRSRREGRVLVVAFVDVDGLKQVNDSRGHLAGDAVIRAVGQALSSSVRGYDVLFRFGGDEFVVGMGGVDVEGARLRLQRVAAALERSSPGQTFSVGFAPAHPDDGVMELLERADADLYQRRMAARHSARDVIDLDVPQQDRG